MELQKKSIDALLESVAILRQELQNNQDLEKEIELLGELKLLSARIYIECDLGMLGQDPENTTDLEKDEVSASGFFEDEVDLDEIKEDTSSPSPELESAPIQQDLFFSSIPVLESKMEDGHHEEIDLAENANSQESFANITNLGLEESENVDAFPFDATPRSSDEGPIDLDSPIQPITFEIPDFSIPTLNSTELYSEELETPINTPEVVMDATPVPAPASAPVLDSGNMPPPALSGMNVEAIINQMPISRRFEFANLLFGGDIQRMGTFIHELLQAPSGSGRMDVYERWYEENNWRRRDEAASEMLRLIKRIFPS